MSCEACGGLEIEGIWGTLELELSGMRWGLVWGSLGALGLEPPVVVSWFGGSRIVRLTWGLGNSW